MIVYHGTSRRRAMRICEVGFLPRKPSRRVWFAEDHGYALGRARTQARRAHDRPVVLTCEVDIQHIRRRLGGKRVFHKNRVIAIDGTIPVTVLRSHPAVDSPTTPKELAGWLNRLLGLKPHKGVPRTHPGVERLSRWVSQRLQHKPRRPARPGELLHLAQHWLPEYFDGVEVDLDRLKVYPKVEQIHVAAEPELAPVDPREIEALECLESDKPARRVRGLKLLVRLEALRSLIDRPLSVTSGARCETHNRESGGKPGSWHLKGLAVDISCVDDEFRGEIIRLAGLLGFNGIGVAKTFIHLDLRPADEKRCFLYD